MNERRAWSPRVDSRAGPEVAWSRWPREFASARVGAGFVCVALACTAMLGTASSVRAQGAPRAAAEVVRAESWPKLDAASAEKVKLEVERLRKARTPEMGAAARDALVAAGAGVAPGLIAGLGREEDREARERIVDVLERVTTAEHSRLLADEFAARAPAEGAKKPTTAGGSPSPVVRKWALRRVATFLDPGVRYQGL